MAHAACLVILRGRQKENPPNTDARDKEGANRKGGCAMRYLVRLVVILVVLAAITVVAYTYFGDMTAAQQRQDQPVSLPGQ